MVQPDVAWWCADERRRSSCIKGKTSIHELSRSEMVGSVSWDLGPMYIEKGSAYGFLLIILSTQNWTCAESRHRMGELCQDGGSTTSTLTTTIFEKSLHSLNGSWNLKTTVETLGLCLFGLPVPALSVMLLIRIFKPGQGWCWWLCIGDQSTSVLCFYPTFHFHSFPNILVSMTFLPQMWILVPALSTPKTCLENEGILNFDEMQAVLSRMETSGFCGWVGHFGNVEWNNVYIYLPFSPLSIFEFLHIQLFFVLQTHHGLPHGVTEIIFHHITRKIFVSDDGSALEIFQQFQPINRSSNHTTWPAIQGVLWLP